MDEATRKEIREHFVGVCNDNGMVLMGSVAIRGQALMEAYWSQPRNTTITRVLFNDPATIVWFSDGDKVVAVCDERDYFDKEKGVLHCIAKKFMGSTEIQKVAVEWEEAENFIFSAEEIEKLFTGHTHQQQPSSKPKAKPGFYRIRGYEYDEY